jgi:hypothetical protein
MERKCRGMIERKCSGMIERKCRGAVGKEKRKWTFPLRDEDGSHGEKRERGWPPPPPPPEGQTVVTLAVVWLFSPDSRCSQRCQLLTRIVGQVYAEISVAIGE